MALLGPLLAPVLCSSAHLFAPLCSLALKSPPLALTNLPLTQDSCTYGHVFPCPCPCSQ
ncbi:hypothetical protein EJ02DRAFT_456957 [Clathrospora elynae]|uniref:Uncharacterized protein n=1 Tax=Clathrospora elynae TaxID=706981 RepID=A0A6A5SIM0_9PLEO|nr:hypothetical protein EJ02DRAFT_456957 [Clathrospora elynae]